MKRGEKKSMDFLMRWHQVGDGRQQVAFDSGVEGAYWRGTHRYG